MKFFFQNNAGWFLYVTVHRCKATKVALKQLVSDSDSVLPAAGTMRIEVFNMALSDANEYIADACICR